MLCSQLIAIALCTLLATATPSLLLCISYAENPLPGRYIVTPKQEQGASSTVNSVKKFSSIVLSASNITLQWESVGAFVGGLSDDDLETLRADPRVEAIERTAS